MALSDLTVYSEYVYLAMTEVLTQQIEMFNAASGGALILSPAAVQGDFSDAVLWKRISGLVRRRNAYGNGAQSEKTLEQLVDTMVKIAAGTPPVRIDPSMLLWIQRNPEEAGVVLGQQLAGDSLADMLNTGLGCLYSAMAQVTSLKLDVTGESTPADRKYSFKHQTTAAAKFGDAASLIQVWVTHSKPLHDLYLNALTNNERLFSYGTVNVSRDPFGRLMVMTDSPSLVTGSTYHNLGLTNGALIVGVNNDFVANEETKNGGENITKTYQAEWSYNVGVKGFAWDKTSGGKSPTDAALFSSANWDRYSTSDKDLPGVVLETL